MVTGDPILSNWFWLINTAQREELEKALVSTKALPASIKLIFVVKSEDLYTNNFVDCYLWKAIKHSVVLHVPQHTSDGDALLVAENFAHSKVYMNIYMRDAITYEQNSMIRAISSFINNFNVDMYAFKEVDKEGTEIYNPSDINFKKAHILLTKRLMKNIISHPGAGIQLGAVSDVLVKVESRVSGNDFYNM